MQTYRIRVSGDPFFDWQSFHQLRTEHAFLFSLHKGCHEFFLPRTT